MPKSTLPELHSQIKVNATEDRMGLMTVSYEIFKHDGELALYAEHLQTVKYRHPSRFRLN